MSKEEVVLSRTMGVVFFSFVAAAPALAQPSALSIGIVVGVDVPSTSLETQLRREGSPSETTSFAAGGFFEGRIQGPLKVRIGVVYVSRETTLRFPDPINALPPIDTTYKLRFLECPIELKATFGTAAVRPYVFAGPSIGLRLSAKSENSSGGRSDEVDAADQFKRANVSIDGGGGISFALGPRAVLLAEARYSYGLTNLAQANGDSWKTRDLRVLAGLGFGF